MKNANYNLVKLLLSKLDDAWRVENHYADDAKHASCANCHALLEKILADDEKHATMLRKELAKHIKDKNFN